MIIWDDNVKLRKACACLEKTNLNEQKKDLELVLEL